jgi:alpha-methylacyl-CoA racemase
MGPLEGVWVIEMAGIGPAPFCAMMLADMGAEVIRIDRKGVPDTLITLSVLKRGRRSAALDLKKPAGAAAVLRLVERADALIEGFRPGVMERLGLGPDVCLERNPRLVYGRMTGWGQDGPLASAPGHDLNYIALTGVLGAIGGPDRPVPPLNLVGDFGGGAMYLAFGITCGLLEANRSGRGQIVDAAMVDGAASLMTPIYGLLADGSWTNARASNFIDGAAHFYGVYRCADDKWVAISAVEPQFYRNLLERIGIGDPDFEDQWNASRWPRLRERLAAVFETRTRAEWCAILEGTDACVAPVLDLEEAPRHPHNRARGTFLSLGGVVQPGPAPRFSRTSPEVTAPPSQPGEHTEAVLKDWGFSDGDLGRLRDEGAI